MINTPQQTAAEFKAFTDMLDHLYETMPQPIRAKIAAQFAIAIGDGADIYDPATGKSPAGEVVMAWANSEADRLDFSSDARMALRHDVRAIGRHLILAAR